MRLTFAFFQLNWRALVALAMLLAFVMPVTAEAACYERPKPSPISVQTDFNSDDASGSMTEAPVPAKKPAGKPSHAASCQHAHCGHAQAWVEVLVDVGASRLSGLESTISFQQASMAGCLIDGLERPPQA